MYDLWSTGFAHLVHLFIFLALAAFCFSFGTYPDKWLEELIELIEQGTLQESQCLAPVLQESQCSAPVLQESQCLAPVVRK